MKINRPPPPRKKKLTTEILQTPVLTTGLCKGRITPTNHAWLSIRKDLISWHLRFHTHRSAICKIKVPNKLSRPLRILTSRLIRSIYEKNVWNRIVVAQCHYLTHIMTKEARKKSKIYRHPTRNLTHLSVTFTIALHRRYKNHTLIKNLGQAIASWSLISSPASSETAKYHNVLENATNLKTLH